MLNPKRFLKKKVISHIYTKKYIGNVAASATSEETKHPGSEVGPMRFCHFV